MVTLNSLMDVDILERQEILRKVFILHGARVLAYPYGAVAV